MATEQKLPKVIKLDMIPLKTEGITHPIQISNHEFAIATDTTTQKLIIYNALTKVWTELFDYSNWKDNATKYKQCKIPNWMYGFNYHTLAYDATNNKY